jgi:SOS-response transcriptional repressor LexA
MGQARKAGQARERNEPMSTAVVDLETGRREQILRFIAKYRQQHHFRSPSMREIGEAVGLSISNIHSWLNHLEKERLILQEPGVVRSVVLTVRAKALLEGQAQG